MEHTKQAFSFVEIIVGIAILVLISTIAVTSYTSIQEKGENSKIQTDIKTIDNGLSLYQEEYKLFPYPDGNLRYYGSEGEYKHIGFDDDIFGVSGYITNTTLDKKYLSTLPLDPRSNQYYAYGVTFDQKNFQVAGITKKYESPQTLVFGNYASIGNNNLTNIIKEYAGPEFVSDKSEKYFPYNPQEKQLVAQIHSYSGQVQLNGKNYTDEEIKNYILSEGDRIWVSTGGQVDLYYSDGSESILGDSVLATDVVLAKMRFQTENNLLTDIKIALNAGEILTKASKLFQGSEFEIYTANTVASVRGTIFSMKYSGKKTEVAVAEGKVEVKKIPQIPVTFQELVQKIQAESQTGTSLGVPLAPSEVGESNIEIDLNTQTSFIEVKKNENPKGGSIEGGENNPIIAEKIDETIIANLLENVQITESVIESETQTGAIQETQTGAIQYCSGQTLSVNNHTYTISYMTNGESKKFLGSTENINSGTTIIGTKTFSIEVSCNEGTLKHDPNDERINITCNLGFSLKNQTCIKDECNDGFHRNNSDECVSNTQECAISDGTGFQTRQEANNSRGECQVRTCNSGFQKEGNTCVNNGCPRSTDSFSNKTLRVDFLNGNYGCYADTEVNRKVKNLFETELGRKPFKWGYEYWIENYQNNLPELGEDFKQSKQREIALGGTGWFLNGFIPYNKSGNLNYYGSEGIISHNSQGIQNNNCVPIFTGGIFKNNTCTGISTNFSLGGEIYNYVKINSFFSGSVKGIYLDNSNNSTNSSYDDYIKYDIPSLTDSNSFKIAISVRGNALKSNDLYYLFDSTNYKLWIEGYEMKGKFGTNELNFKIDSNIEDNKWYTIVLIKDENNYSIQILDNTTNTYVSAPVGSNVSGTSSSPLPNFSGDLYIGSKYENSKYTNQWNDIIDSVSIFYKN